MAIKLNGNDGNKERSFVKGNVEEPAGRKLFQNKTANRVLIVAGIIIAAVIVGCIIMVNINLPWQQ